MEPAVFRPILRGQLRTVLAGGAAGLLLGLIASRALSGLDRLPPLFVALFGAIAAAIVTAARHASGLRLVAGEAGVSVQGGGQPLSAAWGDLRLGFGRTTRPGGGDLQRFAILADPAGRSFAFGDFAGRGPCDAVRGADGRPVEVVELQDAAVLLGVLVQRVPAWHVLPEWLQEVAVPPPLEGEPAAPAAPAAPTSTGTATASGTATATSTATATASATASATAKGTSTGTSTSRIGILAVVAKLGGKLFAALGKVGTGALKAAKGTNLAMAAASAAAWSIFTSWQFAVLLMLQLVVHEYGHVHAMKRTGMRVRGLYFIPFLGAMAVTEDAFTSRRQQAYVALNGPLWGSLLTLLPIGAWALTGSHFWATIAVTWAVINLFNLLPITPLDGGRALAAFAGSFSSQLGVAVGVLGLAGAVALGFTMGLSVIWLVALLGAVELVAESRARAGGRALRLLPEPARFGPVHFQYLRAVVGAPAGPQGELAFARDLVRMEQAARVEPMRRRELAGWGLVYAALAVSLLAVVWFLSHLPGAAEAAGILT